MSDEPLHVLMQMPSGGHADFMMFEEADARFVLDALAAAAEKAGLPAPRLAVKKFEDVKQ